MQKKLGESLNSLSIFCNQNQLNFELGFKEQALPSDVANKEMKLIVYKNANNIKINDKKKLKEIIYEDLKNTKKNMRSKM